jgi:hypothetical protein
VKKLLFLLFLGLAARCWAQPAAAEESRSRFCAVDIYLEAKAAPLAAYQLEFAVANGTAKVVGIEGGEHPAFHEPPFYDPKAIQGDRVILAAFSTSTPEKLPLAKTRVATIHLQVLTPGSPQYDVKVSAAGDAQGKTLLVEAQCEERKPK